MVLERRIGTNRCQRRETERYTTLEGQIKGQEKPLPEGNGGDRTVERWIDGQTDRQTARQTMIVEERQTKKKLLQKGNGQREREQRDRQLDR